MVTQSNLANAASTLAHHWATKTHMDRIGVERCILAYPTDYRPALCVLICRYLEERGDHVPRVLFMDWLYELAHVSEDA
jgi:hypothetical protein